MKVAFTDLAPGLRSKKFRVGVVYGSHASLIQAVVDEACQHCTHQTLTLVQAEGLWRHPPGPSLFGETTPYLTVISSATVTAAVMDCLNHWPESLALLALVGSCPPTLIKHPTMAAVACYECSLQESRVMIQRACQGIVMTPEALSWAAHATRDGQWLGLASTLSLIPQRPVTQEMVQMLVQDPEEDWILPLFDGGACSRAFRSQEDPMKIVRTWQRLLAQAWQLKYLGAERSDQVYPAIFFKHVPWLKKAGQKWSLAHIMVLWERCYDLEKIAKQDAGGWLVAADNFLKLCHNP
jgi:hypothetical protein